MVISAYAKDGFIDHAYYDHDSILKFIEANWGLSPLSSRSRDKLPNPTATSVNPYVPTNAPAIGDLMGSFDFSHLRNKNQDSADYSGRSLSRVAPAPARGRCRRSDTKKRRRSHHAGVAVGQEPGIR